MSQLLGEFECKIDSKGRLRLPIGLINILSEMGASQVVLNRGFEKCLSLYPKKAWDEVAIKIGGLNDFVKKNRDFKRYFLRGATKMNLVGSDRILLQKRLLEYAGIEKNVILAGQGDRIEIWSEEAYNEMIENEPEDFSAIGEEVMGDVHFGGTSTSDSGGPQ